MSIVTILGEDVMCLGPSISLTVSGGVAPYTWTSSDPSIASVSAEGMVSGISEGSVTITAIDANGCLSTHEVAVFSIGIAGEHVLIEGQNISLTASGGVAPYSWTSSDPSIASVSAEGIVSAGINAGSVTITAIDADGCYATHEVINEFNVDLLIAEVGEFDEVEPGVLVALNDDFDEKNTDSQGIPIPDSAPDFSADHRIKADDDHTTLSGDDNELPDTQLLIQGSPGMTGQWKIRFANTGSGQLKVWEYDANAAEWLEVADDIFSVNPVTLVGLVGEIGQAVIPLKLEGIDSTLNANEISLTAEFRPTGATDIYEDTASISVIDVEIWVNNTEISNDDYVTWGPTRCQAFVVGMKGRSEDLNVFMENDPSVDIMIPAGPAMVIPNAPPNPARFSGGRILFAPDTLPAGSTASDETLTLSGPTRLVADGTPVDFRIAGKFGRPSFKDKDVIINVRQNDGSGHIVGNHRLMVRVRKHSEVLHDFEVKLLLDAFKAHKEAGDYNTQADIHAEARRSGDEAHSSIFSQAAFLPWHRVFILEMERGLQCLPGPPEDPDKYRAVALRYWDWDGPSAKLFTSWFMGAPNKLNGSPTTDDATLDEANPLAAWGVAPNPVVTIVRRNHDASVRPMIGGVFRPLDQSSGGLLLQASFGPASWVGAPVDAFTGWIEHDVHNLSHGWNCGGGQLRDPSMSASDPDEMWPWDLTMGGSAGLAQRPFLMGSLFPASEFPYLWPGQAMGVSPKAPIKIGGE